MKVIYTLGVFCILVSGLYSDTVILKNRQVYRGKVVSQNENSLNFKGGDGKTTSFPKKNILRVVYKDLNEQEVRSVIQEEEKKIETPSKKEETPSKKEVVPAKKEESSGNQKDESVTFNWGIPYIPGFWSFCSPKPSCWFPDSGEKLNRWSFSWRSALIPGWGHYLYFKKDEEKQNSVSQDEIRFVPGIGQTPPAQTGLNPKYKKYIYGGTTFLITFMALGYVQNNLQNVDGARADYAGKTLLNVPITSSLSQNSQSDVTVLLTLLVYNQSNFNPYQAAVSKANDAIWIGGFVYGLQLLHSYLLGMAYEKENTVVFINGKSYISGWNFEANQKLDVLTRTYKPEAQIYYSFQF